jgi:hypothetical protein
MNSAVKFRNIASGVYRLKLIRKSHKNPGIDWVLQLASSVNLYRFTHFLDFPFGAIFANLLVGAASPIPFDRYLRYRLLVHSERFPEKEKTWTAIWHPG